jgi:hypothetical protein
MDRPTVLRADTFLTGSTGAATEFDVMRDALKVRRFAPALIAVLCAGCAHQPTAAPDIADGVRSGPLFDELARMDAILFDASFASCDAAKANAIFTDDVEFYHDEAGFSVGEQVRENTRRLTAACPGTRGVTRTVVPGSLRVYPIEGYGAVQMGIHRFDERGAPSSTLARFVHLWRLENGKWRLARVLSLDHHPVDARKPDGGAGDRGP